MYGFLLKNCGRPWNKVFSEICANLNGNGVMQQHIKGHIIDAVQHPHHFANGKPYDARGVEITSYSATSPYFYVDAHGLLQVAPKRQYKGGAPYHPKYIVDSKSRKHFKQLGGLWFELVMKPFADAPGKEARAPDAEARRSLGGLFARFNALTGRHAPPVVLVPMVKDVLHGWVSEQQLVREYGAIPAVYAATKRQVSKAEIKRYGLGKLQTREDDV
jgi:hypothetical protein